MAEAPGSSQQRLERRRAAMRGGSIGVDGVRWALSQGQRRGRPLCQGCGRVALSTRRCRRAAQASSPWERSVSPAHVGDGLAVIGALGVAMDGDGQRLMHQSDGLDKRETSESSRSETPTDFRCVSCARSNPEVTSGRYEYRTHPPITHNPAWMIPVESICPVVICGRHPAPWAPQWIKYH
jgi:hypothetical protein